jgi:hypothetical protein
LLKSNSDMFLHLSFLQNNVSYQYNAYDIFAEDQPCWGKVLRAREELHREKSSDLYLY